MTHDEIRIAVAECCNRNYYDLNCHPDNPCYDDCCEGHSRMLAALPDYPASLDACAEFEKTLKTDDLIDYAEWLGATSNEMHMKSWVVLLRATPLQRCEAFLRVKGKWKEATP